MAWQQSGQVGKGNFNDLNQLTAIGAGDSLVLRGQLDEPGTVTVAGRTMRTDSQNQFSVKVPVTTGNNTVSIQAVDVNNNTTTRNATFSVAAAGNQSFSYDANGNLLSDGLRTYEWDAVNRLVAITHGTKRSEFTYNGWNQRVRERELDNGVEVSDRRFVFDGAELLEVRAADGTTVERRFFSQGFQGGTESFFYIRDHLGSVRGLMDVNGVERGRWSYGFFGERSANAVTTNPVESDLGYTGHKTHFPTGLVQTFYRFYDPETQRWLSRDPIGEEGGINLYGYVSNNPVNLFDPLGLEGWASDLHEQMGGEPGELAQHVQGEGNAVTAEMGAAAATVGIVALQELAFRGVGKLFGPLRRIFSRCPKSSWTPQRLQHIFGKAEHALDDLVKAHGSQEKALDAIQKAANDALAAGKLAPNAAGILPKVGPVIDVGGVPVRLIGGKVVNGQVVISSASRKGL